MKKKVFKILFIFLLLLPFCLYAEELETPNIVSNAMNCSELLGNNLMKILSLMLSLLRIGASIIAIVSGMLIILPAVISKDADALKKSEKKLIILAIVLVLIILLPTLLNVIGNIFGYDLSCLT